MGVGTFRHQGYFLRGRAALRVCAALIAAAFLASCAAAPPATPIATQDPTTTRAELPPPAAPTPLEDLQTGEDTQTSGSRMQIFPGSGTFVREGKAQTAQSETDAEGNIKLNFVNAEVPEVLNAVMGDLLELNYTVDPRVQGKITLQTATPITKDAVLPALETVLDLNGAAIIEAREGFYSVVPKNEAKRRLGAPRLAGTAPGYGLEIVQLKYIAAADMQRILGAIVPEAQIVYVDGTRNLLILSGSDQDMATLLETVDLFDVDYLDSVSFGVFTPENVTPEVLVTELNRILEGSPVLDLVRLIPIPRINTLIAVAKDQSTLRSVRRWAERLDQDIGGPTRRIYLYNAQNVKAGELAQALTQILGLAAPVGVQQTPSNAEGFRSSTAATEGVGEIGGLRIVANERQNLLLIYATVREHRLIKQTLERIDFAPDQVLIEATIAEVSLTDEFKFGFQWNIESQDLSFKLTDDDEGDIVSRFPGFSIGYVVPDVQATLNAISAVTNVQVLSAPKIMVLDNQTASLEVGDEVPIATQSAVGVLDPDAPIVNTIQFRQTGIILEVTPRINKSGLVIMEVTQEVSDVVSTTTSTIDSPTIQQRRFNSTVAVQTGATVALGGLIRDNTTRGNSGVPLLKDIPVVGELFRAQDRTTRRTELLVFMTPRIVKNPAGAEAITRYLKQQLNSIQFTGWN